MTRPASQFLAAAAAIVLTVLTFQQSITVPAGYASIARAQLA